MRCTYIIKTAEMFIAMTLVLCLIGFGIGSIFGFGLPGLGIMVALSILISFFSYYTSKNSALKANHVRLVTRQQEPRLYGIVEKVAREAGLPMPEVGVAETMMPNAFATGRNPKNAAVVATRGVLDLLSDDELEGVIGHEMSHVGNRDILVMSVASCLASILTFAAYSVFRGAVYNMFGDRNSKDSLIWLVVGVLCYIFVSIAALCMQLAVSRNREFFADETGGRITGKPMALASALRKLETGCQSPKNNYDDTRRANMWISNPISKSKRGFAKNLFSTHPDTAERIKRLEALAAKMDRNEVPKFTPGEDTSKVHFKFNASR